MLSVNEALGDHGEVAFIDLERPKLRLEPEVPAVVEADLVEVDVLLGERHRARSLGQRNANAVALEQADRRARGIASVRRDQARRIDPAVHQPIIGPRDRLSHVAAAVDVRPVAKEATERVDLIDVLAGPLRAVRDLPLRMFDAIRLSFRALREQRSVVDVRTLFDEPPILDTREQRARQRDRASVGFDVRDLQLAPRASRPCPQAPSAAGGRRR